MVVMMITLRTIGRVFGIFAADYRDKWTNSVPSDMWDAVANRWFHTLKNFDERTINAAADNTYKTFGISPPTLGQFYELCKRYDRDYEVLALQPRLTIDEEPKEISETAVNALASLRKMFKEKGIS